MLFFNTAQQAQQTYDDFAKRHTKDVHENQEEIEKLLDRDNKEVDRSGKHINEVLEQARDNQRELIKSIVGYINQTKRAAINEIYEREEKKQIKKDSLPRGQTYCCVMKMPILSRKEDIEKAGLKEGDFQILFRLIPCVAYNTGILLNPENGISFISIADVAEYLGEKSSSDGKVAKSMQRLIKAGIIWRYGSLFIMNDLYIRCGEMTTGVLQKRKKKMETWQGKKPTNKQGKKAVKKTIKKDVAEEPQTQVTSGKEVDEAIPFLR